MQIVVILILIYLAFASLLYVLVAIYPAHSPGLLGKLYRLIFVKTPKLFRTIFGESIHNKFVGFKQFVVQRNHHFVQTSYLVLMILGFLFYQISGVLKYMPNKQVDTSRVVILHVMFILCLVSYYKASSVSPGKIDSTNNQLYLAKYESVYDNILYVQQNKCRTCDIIKPPRSKHCRFCNICVPNIDHHSIWLRRCVGQKNRKYYLIMLLVHTIFAMYIGVIGTATLKSVIQNKRLLGMKLNYTNKSVTSFWYMFSFLFIQNTMFIFLIALGYIIGFSLLVFDAYQLYLIKADRTRNQRVKVQNMIIALQKMIDQQNKVISQYGVQNLPDQILIKDQKIGQQQFLKKKQQNLQTYKTLLLSRPQAGIQGFFQRLIAIFKQ